MIKKTIKYHDLDGNPVTEDFYFHLNKAEIAALELSGKNNSLSSWIQQIIDTENGEQIIEIFNKILSRSVGVRSDDNKRFIKTDEIRDNFMQSDAYSELFMELISDSAKGAEFVAGIVPANLIEELERDVAREDAQLTEAQAEVVEGTLVTKKDPREMSREELLAAYRERANDRVQNNS